MADSRGTLVLKTGAKLLFAALILFALVRLGSIDHTLVVEIFKRPATVALAVACLLIGLLLGGLRWWILLDMSGHRYSLKDAMRLQLVGSFFSTYLPGAAGGDLVRGAYILKMVPKNEGRTTAMLSIAIDRLFALLGLILVGAAASAYIFFHDVHSAGLQTYTSAVLVLVILSPVSVILMVVAVIVLPSLLGFGLLPERARTYLLIFRDLAFAYLKFWRRLMVCTIISVVASAIVILGIIMIASAFPFAPPPLVTSMAGVFGNVFSAIPLTPGGLGVGESAFLAVCRELTTKDAPYASIYLTFRILMLLANIPGGVMAVTDRLTRSGS